MKEIKKDIIRYANCWEDGDLLLDALDIQPGDKVLSVGSAGDNSFALLSKNPDLVTAVDINPVQIHVMELKKAAFRVLDHSTFLEFLGFTESGRRKEVYRMVCKELPAETKEYWNRSLEKIEKGLIYSGKFEKYFRFFAKYIVPLIHNRNTIDRLFTPKSPEEQEVFYHEVWENKRWRILFKIFFSKYVMGNFGRDPSFFKEVKVPVAEYIYAKTRNHLSSVECQTNYFLHFILKGRFGKVLPYYARTENYLTIKKNIDSLRTELNLVENINYEKETFNKFNLSNIFEYMSEKEFTEATHNLLRCSDSEARFVYWNLLVSRDMTEVSKKIIKQESKKNMDKGFFYNAFHIILGE